MNKTMRLMWLGTGACVFGVQAYWIAKDPLAPRQFDDLSRASLSVAASTDTGPPSVPNTVLDEFIALPRILPPDVEQG